MLAATSLGAVWSSCSPDFGVNGVIDRFGQIEPKVLFCTDAYPYGGKRFDCLEKSVAWSRKSCPSKNWWSCPIPASGLISTACPMR